MSTFLESLFDTVVEMAWDAAIKSREGDTEQAEAILEALERLLGEALMRSDSL